MSHCTPSEVLKTYKLSYIGGTFVRSESGRYLRGEIPDWRAS